jgi:hypothetical protein
MRAAPAWKNSVNHLRCVILASSFSLGCAADEGLSWRRSVELIALTDQARVLDLRAAEGNTGVERHQAVIRLDRWLTDGAPIEYARRSRSAQTLRENGQIGVEDDLLVRGPEGLSVALRSGELNARLLARSVEPRAERSDGDWRGAWSTVTLDGWVEAGARGGRLHGPALLIEREGSPPRGSRRVLFLRSANVELGLDQQGEQITAWLRRDDDPIGVLDDLEVNLDPWGQGTIRAPSAGLHVELRLGPVRGSSALHDHLSAPEQVLADAWTGRAARRAAMVEARFTAGDGQGVITHATGVFVEIGDPTADPPRRRPWSGGADREEAP